MAFFPSASNNSLGAYLNQWVKVASGNRVTLISGVIASYAPNNSGNTGYFIFKCSQCQDNWHVGHDNFYGNVKDPAAQTVPSVLSDWVKKHRHICKMWQGNPEFKMGSKSGVCTFCQWPYGAHEESWVMVPISQEMGSSWASYNVKYTSPASVKAFNKALTESQSNADPLEPKGMTLKQFTGRKFRDVEETCELLDTSTEKTSTD